MHSGKTCKGIRFIGLGNKKMVKPAKIWREGLVSPCVDFFHMSFAIAMLSDGLRYIFDTPITNLAMPIIIISFGYSWGLGSSTACG